MTVLLLNLHTFPERVPGLSLSAVEAALRHEQLDFNYLDLNFIDEGSSNLWNEISGVDYVALSVSPQTYNQAVRVSSKIKQKGLKTKIIWGGHTPTLTPELCDSYAHSLIRGPVENIAESLVPDIIGDRLQNVYSSDGKARPLTINPINYSFLRSYFGQKTFYGLPLETSKGCTQKCTFCLVHQMQPSIDFSNLESLKKNIESLDGSFVNIVDFNFGMDKEHRSHVLSLLSSSNILGWSAEVCIEDLDDDQFLMQLKNSGCKHVYCGIESITESSLKSVNKDKLNNIKKYRDIIDKARSYGIEVGAGVILGIKGIDSKAYKELEQFVFDAGLYYLKLTFLTFNPGSKVYESMKNVGSYSTENISEFDGHSKTFFYNTGNNFEDEYIELKRFIEGIYSFKSIVRRALKRKGGLLKKMDFLCFNYLYSRPYMSLIQGNRGWSPGELNNLHIKRSKYKIGHSICESILYFVRRINRGEKN